MERPEPRTRAFSLAVAGSACMLMPLPALITSTSAGFLGGYFAAAFLGGYFAAAMLSSLVSLACLLVASFALPGARAGWTRFGAIWRERTIRAGSCWQDSWVRITWWPRP